MDHNSKFIQLNKRYILKINQDAIFIIHQRRANQRILYEYYLKSIKNLNTESQKLLFPVKISLSNQESKIIEELKEDLHKIGFVFNLVEANKPSFEGVPVNCNKDNIQNIIEDIIEQFKENNDVSISQDHRLALSLSSSIAVKDYKQFTEKEMIKLNTELINCDQPSFSPKGKPIMVNFNINDIDKFFK